MRSISKSEAVRNLIIEDIHAGWYASGELCVPVCFRIDEA